MTSALRLLTATLLAAAVAVAIAEPHPKPVHQPAVDPCEPDDRSEGAPLC